MDPAWKPGFETRAQAVKAGRKFFQKTNGALGTEGRDFIITENEHGRFHFDEAPRKARRRIA